MTRLSDWRSGLRRVVAGQYLDLAPRNGRKSSPKAWPAERGCQTHVGVARSNEVGSRLHEGGTVLRVDSHLYHPLDQAIAIIASSMRMEAARKFQAFLPGGEGRAILTKRADTWLPELAEIPLSPEPFVLECGLQIGPWRSLASALAWGARGPGFKSRRPDQSLQRLTATEIF